MDALGHKEIAILANYDDAKKRPDGGAFYPGQEGARKLADALAVMPRRSVRVIYPLKGKDARQWRADGATSASVRAVIRNTALWPRPQTNPTAGERK